MDYEAYGDMLSFFYMLKCGYFPVTNISFQLFLDTVRWYSTEKKEGVRYRDASKEFFKTGGTLFHGQFLRFMQGDKTDSINFDVYMTSILWLILYTYLL